MDNSLLLFLIFIIMFTYKHYLASHCHFIEDGFPYCKPLQGESIYWFLKSATVDNKDYFKNGSIIMLMSRVSFYIIN